jgi:[protein-PII] uridylyltransferase
LAHAERRLAPTGTRRPTEVLPLYKKFLKVEEHRLRLRHQAGGGGREICASRAELVDVLLRYVFGAASSAAARGNGEAELPLALIALGGYGRGELNPFSDVDVMLLHQQRAEVSPHLEEMVNQILYLLWDSGFKVGHSTRSIKEAIVQANRDMRTKTAMLEARFLAGSPELATEFREQFRSKCVVGHERDYVELRMTDQVARHKKFGDSVYLQEPNLKSGCGGLRDYQNLLWITYFKEGSLSTNQLVGKDWLSESDQRRIERAYDFLLRLRTDLHYATGRATDILHMNLQEQVATRLGYSPRKGQLRSEALMRDCYHHTRNILRVTERITEQFVSGHVTSKTRALFSFLPLTRGHKTPIGDSFFVRNKQLHPARRDVFRSDPEQMMRAFELAQQRHLDVSPELEDLLTRSLRHVTRTYQYARGPRVIFTSILSQKGRVGRILRMMHRVDFLGRYIPEFGQLTCLVQHEFLHRYTADEHTLVCIDKLDALAKTDDPKLIHYRKLFEQLADPLVLYLALLLHDSGKAVGRPHSEASALFADGQQGADVAQLGSGNDTFQWDPGDGNDTVEGEGGSDSMAFNGSSIGELLDVSANGDRVRFTRNIANIVMDLDDVERIGLRPVGGTDTATVGDMSGTDLAAVDVDLSLADGSSDPVPDTIVVNGTEKRDVVRLARSGDQVQVNGLAAQTRIVGSELLSDTLRVQTHGGDDSVLVSPAVEELITPVIDLGADE